MGYFARGGAILWRRELKDEPQLVDSFLSAEGARIRARLLNAGEAVVERHRCIGCRVVPTCCTAPSSDPRR